MKNQKCHIVFLAFLSLMLFIFCSENIYAQKVKKSKARISVAYVKIMDGDVYFDVKASARVNKKTVKISDIEILVFNLLKDDKIALGKVTTNIDGEGRFKLNSLNDIKRDSTNNYNLQFIFKGNDQFKSAKKSILFKDVNIKANIITKDSINYMTATLTNVVTNNPIVDESLTVQVQRLFRPLRIGEEFNMTDEKGAILVAIDDDIPGVDGSLTFEVVLNESDDYGTVKVLVKSTIGIPIIDESTFDQRTMWSPRNKTPIFLLIFPNLLIVGVWGLIIYLIINLFKIVKL
ncbi:MAG: hypothetical protein COB73_09090 [Flavobacteriaceae bacterium]|nr:MAG: hypothetical protein COB73_09090 [Flavobacteriaceae bacterium]